MKTRIELNDSLIEVVSKMSDGNPGATSILLKVIDEGIKIDRDSFNGGVGAILSLDMAGIYGSPIYILCNDKCGGDIRKFIILIRGYQLGFVKKERLLELSNDQLRQVNFEENEFENIEKMVLKSLPNFSR